MPQPAQSFRLKENNDRPGFDELENEVVAIGVGLSILALVVFDHLVGMFS